MEGYWVREAPQLLSNLLLCKIHRCAARESESSHPRQTEFVPGFLSEPALLGKVASLFLCYERWLVGFRTEGKQ